MQRMDKKRVEIDEEKRKDLHESFNNRISYVCKLVALVIAVVAFGSIILGHDDLTFVLLGLCVSIALLAIASLQDNSGKK